MSLSSRQLISQLTESPADYYAQAGHSSSCPYLASDAHFRADGSVWIHARWVGFPPVKFEPNEVPKSVRRAVRSPAFKMIDIGQYGYGTLDDIAAIDPVAVKEFSELVDRHNAELGHCRVNKIKPRNKIVTRKGIPFGDFKAFVRAIDDMRFFVDTPAMMRTAAETLQPGEIMSQWVGPPGPGGTYRYLVIGTPEQIDKAARLASKPAND